MPPCSAAVTDRPQVASKHSKKFKYGKDQFWIEIEIAEMEGGDQVVSLRTNHPSDNLLLHWGVEGGANYKGGWRLPAVQPDDTVQYKDRALQTRWKCATAT